VTIPDSPTIDRLVAAAGLGTVNDLTPMIGGANNRVFRVQAEHGPALVKAYFRHPDDPRDRLATEFAFSRFAWTSGIQSIAQPLGCDPEEGIGLFGWVNGKPPSSTDVSEEVLRQATDFVRDLNAARWRSHAALLPNASEACFRITDHLAIVNRRVEGLTTTTNSTALQFVREELVPRWESVRPVAESMARGSGLSLDRLLEPTERYVSPSDFGFHNALLEPTGRVRFLDFEYAGWDDPAKLICDFFCQPRTPVPAWHFEPFSRAVADLFPNPEMVIARARLLLPVYRVKWVCIRLNEFLPMGSRRRVFSSSHDEIEVRESWQLALARDALTAIHDRKEVFA